MDGLLSLFKSYEPKTIETCVLLKIPEKHIFENPCKFVAFIGGPTFYIGFGFDYNQYFRDMPHIGIINEAGL